MKTIDLRSDTVTKPSDAMREVIAQAPVGDDVYGEDPSVNELEEFTAELLGKERALFIPSGTMGNLTALLTHCQRGDEVILGDKAHTFLYEVGGMAALGGVQPHPVPNQPDGTLRLEEIARAIRQEDVHFPTTRLITLENTHNRCGGAPLSKDYTRAVGELAREHDLKLHLDGARVFNAAAALGLEVQELVDPVDSVMFCLSKGLAAPVGSMLCGGRSFIARARKIRKQLGGGMRQAGHMAAAGLYALRHNRSRLGEDHRRAKDLARMLEKVPGLVVDPGGPETNLVYCSLTEQVPWDGQETARKLEDRGILIGVTKPRRFRLVLHYWITDQDLERVGDGFREALA